MNSLADETAMRARMEARGQALANAAAAAAAPQQPLPSIISQPTMFVPGVPFPNLMMGGGMPAFLMNQPMVQPTLPIPTPLGVIQPNTVDASAARPPSGAATSLQSMDRLKSLKERINERASSSAHFCNQTNAFADPYRAMLEETLEPTKDVYAHAVPFPPTAVYEVERVALNPSTPHISPPAPVNFGNANEILRHMGGTRLTEWRSNTAAGEKGMLLMASECAAVVRDLQMKLEIETRRALDLEMRLRQAEDDMLVAQGKSDVAEKERQQWAERHAALDAVYQLEKRQWAEALAAERSAGAMANHEAVGNVVVEHKNLLDMAQSETFAQRMRADKLQADNERLEHVVRELKEQLVVNANMASSSGGTVEKLTKELLLAKQQSTFISTGYKKQDTELRALREQVSAQGEELARFRAIAAEHAILVAQRNDANARLEAMHIQVAENPRLKAELAALKEAHAKLTIEFDEKASRAAELKEILDDIRAQANNAYVQTMGFNTMAEALSPSRGGGVGGVDPILGLLTAAQPAYTPNLEIEKLKHEIELEQRRVEEEKRRWRERNDLV